MKPSPSDTLSTSANGKKPNRFKIFAGAIILLSIPLLLLFFKPFSSASRTLTKAENIAALEQAVKTNPVYANLINLSVAYINNNQPFRSIQYLKEALKKDPNSSIAYNNLGVVNIMLKNYNEAIENCQKAVALDTGFVLAKNNLKWANNEKNKVMMSLQTMERTPEDKRDVKFFTDCGIKYLSIGAYDECIANCKKGLKKDPTNTILLNNAGTALMMKKQYAGAIAEFKKILDADGGNQLAKNNITWAENEQKVQP